MRAIILVIVFVALAFLITTSVYWLVCWSFDLVFTWKYAVGVYVIWMLVVQIFGSKK